MDWFADERATNAGRNDIDLYCLTCGYNLRGLSGDPRRCPECGNLNPVGDLEIPANLIKAQLYRMESAPACGVAVLLLTVIVWAAFSIGWAWSPRWPRSSPESFACAFCLSLLLPPAWLLCMHSFRKSCLDHAGWFALWVRYQTFGAAMALLVLSPIFFSRELADPLTGGWYSRHTGIRQFGILIVLVIAVAVILFTQRTYRRMREEMDVMQRGVAVDIARETLRKRLGRQRSSGLGWPV
jgi:hypothetical protein